MPSASPYCVPRSIPGVSSRIMTDYYGIPMRGMYFVENTLDGSPPARVPADPVILAAGTFDPHRGEYRTHLIESLLRNNGVSTVLEAHYAYDGQTGRIEPRPVIDDFREIALDQRSAPRLVALCGGCLAPMEALLEAAESPVPSRVRGVLFVSSFLPDFMSVTGHIVAAITFRQATAQGSKIFTYAGHGEVLENGRRMFEWYRNSRLRELVHDRTHVRPFPIPVRTVYFRLDMLSPRGKRAVSRIFSPEPMRFLRGLHNTLRRIPESDQRIIDFCNEAPAAPSHRDISIPAMARSMR